ncbi:MAG: 4-hydroxybenzoate 3-monooxygenase, partial [Alphaproteobacteria bacterium]
MRVQVAIIGSGPAGLLLGQRLTAAGVDNVILEKQSQAYVLGRIRAGVLEDGTVRQLRELGVANRLDVEGLVHDGVEIAIEGRRRRIDLKAHSGGRSIVVYGQTEVTRDLMEARAAAGAPTVYEALDVAPEGFDGDRPRVAYAKDGVRREIACDYVVGADGFHGVARASVPDAAVRTYEQVYPYAWLGLLADVRPVSDELIYVRHTRGFALCSMRSPTRSRYYLQVEPETDPRAWTATAFFDELKRRVGPETADAIETGPPLELSVAPLRAFVAEPLRFGRLFLIGDAGHIVPPTGAKGLNLAASDAYYLAEGFRERYETGSTAGLDAYSARALARVWKAVRFS